MKCEPENMCWGRGLPSSEKFVKIVGGSLHLETYIQYYMLAANLLITRLVISDKMRSLLM